MIFTFLGSAFLYSTAFDRQREGDGTCDGIAKYYGG
jgi:hypothetical protein